MHFRAYTNTKKQFSRSWLNYSKMNRRRRSITTLYNFGNLFHQQFSRWNKRSLSEYSEALGGISYRNYEQFNRVHENL